MSANISPDSLAEEILADCLAGRQYPEAPLQQLTQSALAPETATAASQALFRILIERLGDLFQPSLCLAYADLFSQVIAMAFPEVNADRLRERYHRIRQIRRFSGDSNSIRNVFVLSRVTLGADIAVTSVLMQAAKQKFPQARIHFVGPVKNYALFANDPAIRHMPLPYGRSATLRGRLAVWPDLQRIVTQPESITIDPDSRLSQLGLLPVCKEEDYFFFESRSYASKEAAPLSLLAARWAQEVFGVERVQPYLDPLPVDSLRRPAATVSLGVGGNDSKALGEQFERDLVETLADYAKIYLDLGFGPEEAGRVSRAAATLAGRVEFCEGEFAPFASRIMRSDLYAGYDSVGQHVAAAAGVPCLVFFKGYVSERMYQRWQPSGPGWRRVFRIGEKPPSDLISQARQALEEWTHLI